MLLAHRGLTIDEDAIVRELQRFPQGVYLYQLERLNNWLPHVEVDIRHPGSADYLRALLDRGEPALVFLDTASLPYWDQATYHAVIAVAWDEKGVHVHDPRYPSTVANMPRCVSTEDLLRAWEGVGMPIVVLRALSGS